jgi:hypothetical protein
MDSTSIADFGRRDVTMNWNPWRFGVDVEFTREADGRLGATVSTNEPGLELEQTRFYADDPWKKSGTKNSGSASRAVTVTVLPCKAIRGGMVGTCTSSTTAAGKRIWRGRAGGCFDVRYDHVSPARIDAAGGGVDVIRTRRFHAGPGVVASSDNVAGVITGGVKLWRNVDGRVGGGYGLEGTTAFTEVSVTTR